eukprot:COSAG03_NODE_907_length_5395_cov_22.136707_6_plen_312_part_00
MRGLSHTGAVDRQQLASFHLFRAQHTATLGAMHQRAAADQARVRPGSRFQKRETDRDRERDRDRGGDTQRERKRDRDGETERPPARCRLRPPARCRPPGSLQAAAPGSLQAAAPGSQPLTTLSTVTGPTAPEPLWAIDHQVFQALDFVLDEVGRNAEPLPTSSQYRGACPDSGHVASVHRSPGGAYVFSIPPRSVLRSAPPVGGVKEPPGDEEPSSPDHIDMVATFAVNRSGHLLRAPSQLVLLLRDYTLTTRARYPAGCTFRIPDALGRQLAGVTAPPQREANAAAYRPWRRRVEPSPNAGVAEAPTVSR